MRNHFLLIAVICSILSILLLKPDRALFSDSARFMVLAKSLSTGYGYRLINFPHLPKDTLYPPGYPTLLALVMLLGGDNILLLKLLTRIFYVASIFVLFGLFSRYQRTAIVGMVTLLVAINPWVLSYSDYLMAELPYLFFSLLTLYFLGKYTGRVQEERSLILGGLSLVIAYYIKTVALSLIVASFVYLGIRKEGKGIIVLVIIVACLLSPWLIRNHLLLTSPSGQREEGIFNDDPYWSGRGSYMDQFIKVKRPPMGQRLKAFLFTSPAQIVFPHFPHFRQLVSSRWIGWASLVLITTILLFGLWSNIRQNLHAEDVYTVFFLALVVAWGGTDPRDYKRYLVPLVPFIIFYFILGVEGILNSIRTPWFKRIHQRVLLALCLGLAFSSFMLDSSYIGNNLRYLFRGEEVRYYLPEEASCYPEWSNYVGVSRWLRGISRQTTIMCGNPYWLYLLSQKSTTIYPFASDPQRVISAIEYQKVDYVIEDALTPMTRAYLSPALQAKGEMFSKVYEIPLSKTVIWKVERAR